MAGGGESVLVVQYFVLLPFCSGLSLFRLSNSNSMSLTMRIQRIFANDWNLVGIERTERARLRKNNVLASKSRFACKIADISASAFLRRLAGEGPFEAAVAVMVDGIVVAKLGRKLLKAAAEENPLVVL